MLCWKDAAFCGFSDACGNGDCPVRFDSADYEEYKLNAEENNEIVLGVMMFDGKTDNCGFIPIGA